jgi:membrane-associated phospholipid phosphatase
VKVKSFRTPRPLLAAVAQGRTILRGCWIVFRQIKAATLIIVLGAILLAWILWPHDSTLLDALRSSSLYNHAAAHNLAWYLGTFGDYPTYNLPVAIILWLAGIATKSTSLRRLAVIAFLGATLAGLFDDCFRLTLGRPRPDMLSHGHLEDRFYGPLIALRGGFQSFPSGHAASTFGMGIALLMTEWRLGLVTTFIAFAVVWARMELGRHYPSDVLVGAIIGIYFGLLVGYGGRLRRPVRPLDSRAGSY